MKLIEQSSGIYVATEDIAEVSENELILLKNTAALSLKGRSRICAHQSSDDPIQEMIIDVPEQCYIRPHKHLYKSESMCALEGSADVIIFNNNGQVKKVFRISPPGGKGIFYYRLNKQIYHSILVCSQHFIFHETSLGPFTHETSMPAPWSPDETNSAEGLKFLKKAIEEGCI